MDNILKKTLSFLLAVIMLMSMFLVSASANTYVTNAQVGYSPYRWNHGTYTGYVNDSNLPDGQGTLYYANDDANIYQLHWQGYTYNAIYYTGGFSDGFCYGYGQKYFEGGVWLEGNYNGAVSNVYNNTSDKIIWRGTVYWNGSAYQNAREIATSATTSYWEWDPCNYVISYDANGGSGAPGSQTKVENTNLTLSSTKPTRSGYSFLNWNTKADGTGTSYAPGSTYSANAAATLYAQWSSEAYTISYDANGGTGAPNSQIKYTDVNINLSTQIPVREGYTFLGWAQKYAFSSGGTWPLYEYKSDISSVYATPQYQPGDTYSGNSNTTLYAVWQGSCFVYYDANGGTKAPPTQTFCEGGSVTISGSIPKKSGCIFKGWAVSADATEPVYQPYDIYSGDTITLYAVWSDREEDTFIVTYDANGGTGGPDYQIKYKNQDLVLSTEIPTKIGYRFDYWQKKSTFGLPFGIVNPGEIYDIDQDLSLVAYWSAVGTSLYHIETYIMNTLGDYELFSEEEIECTNNEIVTADYTVNEGFTLNEELSILSGTVRASSSLVLKVYIDRNKHNLTFNDGTTTLTNEYYYEQSIGNVYYPQKEGYTFLGWSEDGETVADVVTTMPDRDIEYTALWSVNKYSITFLYGDVNDNAVYQTVTQNYGTDVSVPEDPEFEGYTFIGWNSDIPGTMPSNNLTITALWLINSYTVTYKLDGVEYFATPYETAVDTIVYGGTVPVREKAVREGYTVSDWEFTPALVAGKMPASDVVANAISTANSYSLTIDYIIADGHDELTPSSYSEDVPFGQPYSIDSPAIMGYTPDIVTVKGTMGNEPIAVTVTYEPNDYALVISYVMSDGNNTVKPADVEQRVTYNTGYNVTSPVIMGYSPDITSVTGTMDSVDGKTVTVTYAPNPHTVTWFIDGEIYQCDSVVFGDTIVAPIPEKEGYTLSDWTPTVAATVADEDYEYNATWIANEYELSIIYVMSDGSDAPAAYSGQVTYNTAYNVESPSVTGYTPDIAVVEGTMDDVNGKTVTVTYEPNAHTVTWNVDGEKTVDDVVYGEEIVKPADPEKEGYTFEGWSEDGETVVEVEETVPDRDIEYIALWTINSYTVTYKLDGAEYFATPYESAVDTVVYGETVTVREKAVKEGYTASDWVFTPALVDGRMPAGDVVANATSTVNSYTITYNVDGVKYDEKTYEYNADVIKLDEPPKQGFIFSGWDREEPAKMPAENLILNGSFSAATDTGYTVETYVMNLSGEYDKTSESLTGTTGETVAAEYTVTEGFSLNTDKSELEGVIAADGSLVLKVYLDRNKHNISFNDGTNTTSDELYYGDEITKSEDPEKEGYTFEGWSEDGETVVDVAETVPDRDIEYIAVWSVNQYRITLYYGEVNDNAVYKTITEDFGTAIEEIADPKFEGYSFTGWSMQIPATMPSENINISALWNINSYTITYKLDGVEYFATPYESAVDTVVYGESVTVREKAVKEGYTVSDWEFSPALVDGRMPAGDVVANATSTVNTYTLTFTYGEVNSGAVYKEITADYGSEINTPANPEFSGFIFREWDSDIPSTMPAENRTINALWDNGEFTVTYKLDGEDYPDAESASDTFLYGEPVTVRDKAVKEGYTVSDWTFTPALEDGKMPASNVAANATSMVNSYTVTWIVNGSSTVDTYNFGAGIIRPEDPSIAGKVFKGWSGEIPETMPARNLVFVASFDAITHTATFVVPDKNGSYTDETGIYEVVKTVTFEEGQTAIAEPAVPQKDGYVGIWEDYTLGKEDIVIKAIYTITDTDNTGKIKTDKTADKNSDGSVTITLNAWSNAQSILVDGENEPLDIVLVVDQSGSMAYKMGKNENAAVGQRRRDYLVNTAKSFVNSVKQNAEATGADHRISIVGFAMGSEGSGYEYPAYLNTEVLTTINDRPVTYNNAKDSVYRNSLMSVTDNYGHIIAAINNIDAKGATAADLGFDMAAKVLSENASDRKKVIVFLTDGEPTTNKEFESDVANKAITSSKYLKAQGVTVYSIAISDKANPGDTSGDFSRFLHATSSNYSSASSLLYLGEGENSGYFLSVRDSNALQKIFDNIYVRSVAKTLNFGAVTLYDTVKREFTMTVPQEKAFRENMIAKYGVKNSDITVDRRDDGTTYIEVRNITPYAYYDSTNVQQGWKADVSFDVTPNENAINAGDYLTNTDEAGVTVGGCTVATFVSPTVSLDGNRCIVEFITGNEIYEIREMNIGDEIVAPVCDYATWTIPEGTKVSIRVDKYYADLGEKDKTVIWHIGEETITQNYATGEKITPPEVNVADKAFSGWSPSNEAYMGYINLEYTALFSEHTHNFKKTSSSGLCTESRNITYICSCGESYTETLPACEHKLETTVYETGSATITHIFCTECPFSEDKVLTFKTANSASYGWYPNSTVASFDLYNDVNGGEIHNLDKNQYIYIRVPISSLTESCQNSLNQGRTINVIHYLANGGTEKCSYAVDGDYIIVKCTSFSYYVFTTEDVDSSVNNATLDCVFDGHQFKYVYNNDATTKKDGTETEVCSHCGATGNTRTAAGTKLESEYKLPSNFKEQSAAYKTYVTINVTLKDVPSGAKVYIDGKEATVSGNKYSADIGQVKETRNVKIEVKQGSRVLDSSSLTVNVNSNFFAKLVSFFVNFLFNLFKWKKVTLTF